MKILIDTNVLLDALLEREPNAKVTAKLLDLLCFDLCEAYVATKAITDLHYTLRKFMKGSKESVRSAIGSCLCLVELADTTGKDVRYAFTSSMTDFEDSIVASVAANYGIDYIITSDKKGFTDSPVPSITPDTAVEMLQKIYDENYSGKTPHSTLATAYFK